jgi:RNA polymerase sigma-70 factor (ECF subfamily)
VYRERDPLLPDEVFQALLARARGGDADALGELWQAVAPTLLQQADKRLPERLQSLCNPSDLVHDTYLRFHTKLKTFEGSTCGQLEAWLQTIMRNLLIDKIPTSISEPYPSQEPSGSGTSPSQGAQRAEDQAKVRKCLARLSEDDQQALDLVVFRGLSHKEAAQVLGIKHDTLTKRFARAIPRLQRQLEIEGIRVEDYL